MIAKGWIPRLVLGLTLVVVAGLSWVPGSLAQTGEVQRYFPETGHVVRGDFLVFFDTFGGLEIFGYPVTEPFIQNGLLVQYFQNARFEAHPTNPAPYRVQLGLLGLELNYNRPPVARSEPDSRDRQYFPETGHTVVHAFLDFFRTKGNIDAFGYPITETYYEGGRIVQYFQRLKMEWRPEDRAAPVKIGNLGELYLDVYRETIPVEVFRPVSNPQVNTATQGLLGASNSGLQVKLSSQYTVLSRQQDQIITLLVRTPDGQPCPNAVVQVQLLDTASKVLGASGPVPTDVRGHVKIPMAISGGRIGERVLIHAAVTCETLQATVEGSFLLWW